METVPEPEEKELELDIPLYFPYVPISLLHFYGLNDDFFSSDVFNNFVIDEFLYRFMVMEREEEFSDMLHGLREIIESAERDTTVSFQTKPKIKKRYTRKFYFMDVFNNSRYIKYWLPIMPIKARSFFQLKPEVLVLMRRRIGWNEEQWIRQTPSAGLGRELGHLYNESVASNLFPILIFMRDDYQDKNNFVIFIEPIEKSNYFGIFFLLIFLNFTYNWNARFSLISLHIVRIYEYFLFWCFYFIDSFVDNFYNDIYLYYLKSFLNNIPGFTNIFYTPIKWSSINLPISEWIHKRNLTKKKTGIFVKLFKRVLFWGGNES